MGREGRRKEGKKSEGMASFLREEGKARGEGGLFASLKAGDGWEGEEGRRRRKRRRRRGGRSKVEGRRWEVSSSSKEDCHVVPLGFPVTACPAELSFQEGKKKGGGSELERKTGQIGRSLASLSLGSADSFLLVDASVHELPE